MRNLVYPLMKRRMSWNNLKPLDGRAGWVSGLGPWYESSNRVNRGLKPWAYMGESGDVQKLPARIRSHV